MSQTFFYVSHAGQEIGPFSFEEVHKKYDKKELSDYDFIYVEEKEDWLGLTDFFAWMKTQLQVEVASVDSSEKIHDFEVIAPSLHLREPEPEPELQPVLPLSVFTLPPNEDQSDSVAINAPCPAESIKKNEYQPLTKASPKTSVESVGVQATHTLPSTFTQNSAHLVIELDSLQAGNFKLQVQSLQGDHLVREVKDIQVRPGYASQVMAQAPESVVAGEELKLSWRALDKFGTLADDFNGLEHFHLLSQNGQKLLEFSIQFHNGTAHSECRLTKAEEVQVHHVRSPQSLDFKQSIFIHVRPASVFKFALEVPHEVRAGEKVQVRVVGIDQFGNSVDNLPENPQVQIVNAMGEPMGKEVGIQLHEVPAKTS